MEGLKKKDPLEKGNGNPLQYSCLENPMDRGARQATIHGGAKVGHDLATKPPYIIYVYTCSSLCMCVCTHIPLKLR